MINVGDVIGRLTILERGETHIYKNGAKDTEWICQCNCQNKTIVKKLYSNLVKRNRTPSCGCIGREKTSIRSKKYNRYDLSGEYGIGYASNTNNLFYFDLENYDLIKNFCWREDEYSSGNLIRLKRPFKQELKLKINISASIVIGIVLLFQSHSKKSSRKKLSNF